MLLGGEHGFDLNRCASFADNLLDWIELHSDYAAASGSSESELSKKQQAAELFHLKLEALTRLNRFGFTYYGERNAFQ